MPSMTQVLRPVEMLSDLEEVLLLKNPELLRDILERIWVAIEGLESDIRAEVKAREEAMAFAAEQHEAISKTVKLWDGRMQATDMRLDAAHQQLGMQLCNGTGAEARASVEHVLQRVQQDIQQLRVDFVDTAGPSQPAEPKAAARVDKLEKQMKVHKEESWSRLANAEKQSEIQEEKFHAELVKRVGRRELEKSMDELRTELFKVRCDLSCEAAELAQSLRSQLSILSAEVKERVSTSPEVSMTEAQSATQGTQGDMPGCSRGGRNGFSENKGVPLLQPQHSESLQCPLRPPPASRPRGRRPNSEEPRPAARHTLARRNSAAVPDSRVLSPGVSTPLHSTHDEQMSEGLPDSRPATALPPRCQSKRRPSMQGRIRPGSARNHQNDLRSLVVEACRVQSARSMVM